MTATNSSRDWSNSDDAFRHVISIEVPNCVVELCEKCFYVELGDHCFCRCMSLLSVTFGASSRLERICALAFYEAGIKSLPLPDRVVELVRSCLCDCQRLENVTFSAASTLERICFESFLRTNIEALSIPDSVVELNKAIYDNCESSECCIR